MLFRSLAVDNTGQTAIFSGSNTLGINAECQSQNAAAAGNLLANTTIPASMVAVFHQTSGHLGDRLIATMFAGLDAGGEAGKDAEQSRDGRSGLRRARPSKSFFAAVPKPSVHPRTILSGKLGHNIVGSAQEFNSSLRKPDRQD